MNKIVLKAEDLDGYLTEDDRNNIKQPDDFYAEASRLITKLRNRKTQHQEFVYYIQRAYELLFNLAYGEKSKSGKKNYLIIDTPVTYPVQNYAVHKIPDVDHFVENTVMCVMLRGALLPSMIMSKEIEEYSSSNYVTPFALFKIKRDDSKREYNMAYIVPGLGDAGDRLNGEDESDYPRNIIQLIADYGTNITSLYRAQLRKIEETVLG